MSHATIAATLWPSRSAALPGLTLRSLALVAAASA